MFEARKDGCNLQLKEISSQKRGWDNFGSYELVKNIILVRFVSVSNTHKEENGKLCLGNV